MKKFQRYVAYLIVLQLCSDDHKEFSKEIKLVLYLHYSSNGLLEFTFCDRLRNGLCLRTVGDSRNKTIINNELV